MSGPYSNGPVMFTPISNVTATLGANSPGLGTKVIYQGNEYCYVYNAGNSQISKGYAAVVSAVSGYSVTVSSVTMVDVPFGVCKHATLTTGTYGWLLTRGFVDLKSVANSAVAAGSPLTLGADGVSVQAITTMTGQSHGKAMTATGSAGTFGAHVRCFG